MQNSSSFSSAFAGGIVGCLLTLLLLSNYPLLQQRLFPASLPPANPQEELVRTSDVSSVVEQTTPAVVSIIVSKDVPVIERYQENPFGNLFPYFSIPRYRQNGTKKQEIGGGSGFLISSDGYIVSNAHVVEDASAEYTVFLNDDRSFPATIIAADDILDVAVLKIDATELPFLPFGDSDKVKLGSPVIAIGNALGEFRNTVSTGVVSGLSRSIVASDGYGAPENLENVIQTDAAVNPGNSGGPLLNLDGQVIGVNVAVASGSENIGFSLPANMVKTAVDSIKVNGRVVRPYLGVRYLPITPSLQAHNHLSVDYGVLIVRGEQIGDLAVIPGTPADKAGLVENDIILEIDGVNIDEKHSLASLLRQKTVGSTITLTILHQGEEKRVTLVLDELPTLLNR
jgi:serine protease Do